MGGGDAGGYEVCAVERRELRGAVFGPPEGGERVQLRLLTSGRA